MKKSNLLLAVCILTAAILHLATFNSYAQGKHPATQSRDISFTLEDRDRIIQTQVKVESLQNEMNTRFESMNIRFGSQEKEITSLRNEIITKFETLYWATGIIITMLLFLFGYIIYDRKTAIEPLRDRSYSLSEKYNNIIQTLKEYAKEHPKLSEILKAHGIL